MTSRHYSYLREISRSPSSDGQTENPNYKKTKRKPTTPPQSSSDEMLDVDFVDTRKLPIPTTFTIHHTPSVPTSKDHDDLYHLPKQTAFLGGPQGEALNFPADYFFRFFPQTKEGFLAPGDAFLSWLAFATGLKITDLVYVTPDEKLTRHATSNNLNNFPVFKLLFQTPFLSQVVLPVIIVKVVQYSFPSSSWRCEVIRKGQAKRRKLQLFWARRAGSEV